MQTQDDPNYLSFSPSCIICHAQNETLRTVSYPFVFSVLIMTFRRVFSGTYCSKHQRRYHLLAGLITSTVGWLGIPYGFFLTPLTLFKLARGGIINKDASLQVLRSIADAKIKNADVQGAVRCLEESLKIEDSPEISGKLKILYRQIGSSSTPDTSKNLWQYLNVPILLGTSILTGLLINLLDNLFLVALNPLFGNSDSIFVAILSWLPTVTLIFFAILMLRSLVRWAVSKNQYASAPFAGALAIISTMFAFYSILEGEAIVRNIQAILAFYYLSPLDGIYAVRSILAHGSVDVIINDFNQESLRIIIFYGIFLSGLGLSLFSGLETAILTMHWQERLSKIQDVLVLDEERRPIYHWAILASTLLAIGTVLAWTYPGRYVNIEALNSQIDLGLSDLNQGQADEAVIRFTSVQSQWPGSVSGHLYLGVGYFVQNRYDQALEEFDQGLVIDSNSAILHLFKANILAAKSEFRNAIEEFDFVAEAQSQWGLPHAAMAIMYYDLDEQDRAEQEIKTAIAEEFDDGQTSSMIGAYYVATLDFIKGEEYLQKAIASENNPDDYLGLANIYSSQNKFDQAREAIEEGSRLGALPVDVYMAKVQLAEFMDDYDSAGRILSEAIESFPNNADLLAERSFVAFHDGRTNQAVMDAKAAIKLNPYNSQAYIELAYGFYAQNNLKEALAAAEEAVSLAPKYDRAHYILGLCYMDGGFREMSITSFETFLDLYWERPTFPGYREKAEKYLEGLK